MNRTCRAVFVDLSERRTLAVIFLSGALVFAGLIGLVVFVFSVARAPGIPPLPEMIGALYEGLPIGGDVE
jgi:hypothetical protein